MERFWQKVNKTDSCWIWTGCKNTYGYGHFRIGKRQLGAHIASLLIDGVDVPSGVSVLHHCDNRACVRPDHLYLGDHKQNMKDRQNRKRQARGERQGNAKLCELDVWLIKNIDQRQQDIADFFGITQASVSAIKTGKNWAHVK